MTRVHTLIRAREKCDLCVTFDAFPSSFRLTDKVPKEYAVYRSPLLFWGLVDLVYDMYRVSTSPFPSDMFQSGFGAELTAQVGAACLTLWLLLSLQKVPTSNTEGGWSFSLAEYVRHNDMPIYEASERVLRAFQDELMPAESLSEFFDVVGQYTAGLRGNDFEHVALGVMSEWRLCTFWIKVSSPYTGYSVFFLLYFR